jgi:uncharacterized protein (TIGR02145 family)
MISIRTLLKCLMICHFGMFLIGCDKNDEEVKEIEYGSVTDAQGNVYKTVFIGNQWWMAENLRTTQFNDGTSIRNVSSNDSNTFWLSTTEPCFTALNSGAQGLLYNGYVVSSDKPIAPIGWHIATDQDWKQLEATIGMTTMEQKQTGWRGEGLAQEITSLNSQGWPSGVALFGSNSTGFNAKPTGCRIADGRTNIFNNTAFWWTTTTDSTGFYYRYIDANSQGIFRQTENIHYGMAIRCVKD